MTRAHGEEDAAILLVDQKYCSLGCGGAETSLTLRVETHLELICKLQGSELHYKSETSQVHRQKGQADG